MPAGPDLSQPRSPEPPAAGAGAWLKAVSQNIASIALILTTLVGLPSLLFTWSNQSTERFKAFNTAVEREEERWRGLYLQYFTALADKSDADTAAKPGKALVADAKFRALCLFATPRQFPDFHEFKLGFWQPSGNTPNHVAAKERIEDLQRGLVGALSDPRTASEASAACMRQRLGDEEAEDRLKRGREGAAAAPPAAPSADGKSMAAPALTPPKVTAAALGVTTALVRQDKPLLARSGPAADQPASLTLSAGVANGWDIDVFWCDGSGADDNLARARRAAAALIGWRPPGQGAVIGRVRLRILPVDKQLDPGYPSRGFQVRGEALQAAEGALARAIAAHLNTVPGVRDGRAAQFVYFPTSMKTPWYLSAFVCSD